MLWLMPISQSVNALNRGPLAHVKHDSLRFNNWNLSLNYEIMVDRSSTRGQVATQDGTKKRERERERERFVSRSHGNKGLDAISSWAARGHILRSLLRLLLVRLGDAWGCIHFGSLQTIHIHYKNNEVSAKFIALSNKRHQIATLLRVDARQGICTFLTAAAATDAYKHITQC